jgi:two-component system, NarL family, sensor kinase
VQLAGASPVWRALNHLGLLLCHFEQILETINGTIQPSNKLFFRRFPGGFMWTLSKRSRQHALSHAQLESIILERTAELQNLSQRLLKVQDDERRKLARDLHDSTGQILAALRISVSILEKECKQNSLTPSLVSDIAALADQAIEEIRTTSYLLHPPLLDEVGFICAAEWYVEGFAKRSGISVTLDLATAEERLPMTLETALFRILQESLTNVHRHSAAARVRVCFQRQAQGVILEIRDFGCGIAAERLAKLREASAETGVGLAGMRERLNEFAGRLEIESDKDGTTIRAIVPLSTTSKFFPSRECRQIALPSFSAGLFVIEGGV